MLPILGALSIPVEVFPALKWVKSGECTKILQCRERPETRQENAVIQITFEHVLTLMNPDPPLTGLCRLQGVFEPYRLHMK